MGVGPKGEGAATEATSAGKPEKRKRSKSFPTLALPDAIAIIEVAGANGMEHSLTAFAKYCNHTTANSGGFKQKISSFKDWKLVSVNDDKVTITDSSRPLILKRDAAGIAAATRSAFLGCDIMARFYEGVAKGVPYSLDDLKKHAVVDFEVSAESSEAFARSIGRSAIAAGLADQTDENGGVRFKNSTSGVEEPKVDEPPADKDTEIERPREERRDEHEDKVVRRSDAPIVVRQVWETKNGSVTFEIRSHDPLDATAFGAVASVVKEAGELAQALGEPEGDSLGAA